MLRPNTWTGWKVRKILPSVLMHIAMVTIHVIRSLELISQMRCPITHKRSGCKDASLCTEQWQIDAGQKGSDASAREATRKLVAARKQLLKLYQVLLLCGGAPSRELQAAAGSAADGLKQAPRNMIVRNTLRNLR